MKHKGKGKRKEHGQLGVHLGFHPENYSKNVGWEPTLFVFYAPGHNRFTLESIDYILQGEFICPKDNRMWRWREEDENTAPTDSWMFAVPLVAINNEADIQSKIVEPAKVLLAEPVNSEAALKCDKSFFRFAWTGETFTMAI